MTDEFCLRNTNNNKENSTSFNGKSEEKKKCYTRQQLKIIFLLNFLMLLVGAGYSLLAPFYPREAERKGASPSVYGVIIGIYQLMNFLLAPVYGKYIKEIGAKFLFNAGVYTMACSMALFGLLDKAPAGMPFIVLSFSLRITEALGNAAFITGSYAITAHEFKDNIPATFSYLQSSFSAGMIIGPTFGGYLYEVGGFLTPFAVSGSLLLLGAFATSFILPNIDVEKSNKTISIIPLLRRPSTIVSFFSSFALFFSFGFINSCLEPHLRQFHLRSTVIGIMFVIDGIVSSIFNRLWGFLAQKYGNLKLLCAISGVIVAIGFSFLGPLPFFPIEPQVWLVAVSLGEYALGIGGECLIPFLDIIGEAHRIGYPNNLETYGIATGIWTSATSLGVFVGPSIGGFMLDTIGFRNASFVVVGLHCIVIISNLLFWFYEKHWKLNPEKVPLIKA